MGGIFGGVILDILWPPPGFTAPDENCYSIVLALTLGSVTFVLTGDATAVNWPSILPPCRRARRSSRRLIMAPETARLIFLELPRGSRKLRVVLPRVKVAMSSHTRPHNHPHPDVITALNGAIPPLEDFRTDEHFHLRFTTDGKTVNVQYSHV